MSESKKKSFLNGAIILGVAGLICKVIGAVYKIPLRNIVGAETMGIYSAVYPIYTFLLIFSTSGIPTAISKMVAERCSVGDYRGAHKVFRTARNLLFWIGSITTVMMLLGSKFIADAMAISDWTPVAAIAPSLFFVSILSAYRGYYQGLQNMRPTAITQLAEQAFKLIFGFFFAITWYRKYNSPTLGATGALLGITISELLAYVMIRFTYHRSKAMIQYRISTSVHEKKIAPRTLTKRFLQIAIPITIGAAIKPLVDGVDSFMVLNILDKIGLSDSYAKMLYGFLKSDCGTLINLPVVLTTALSMALVPAISDALSRKSGEVKKISATGIKLSLIIGLPSTIGFYTMAREILELLYTYSQEDYIQHATLFLQILSFGVLFLSVVQTAAGILQGLGKAVLPVITLLIGMIVKIGINLVFVTNPAINIVGVPIGTSICFAISGILDVILVVRFVHFRFRLTEMILRPVAASALMLASILAMRYLFAAHLGSKVLTLMIISVAVLVYAIGLVVFSVFNKNDLELMPGGNKIRALLKRLHVRVRSFE